MEGSALIGGQNGEGVPHKHLEGSLVYMYFPSLSLENKLFGIHQTSFLPVEALSFQS